MSWVTVTSKKFYNLDTWTPVVNVIKIYLCHWCYNKKKLDSLTPKSIIRIFNIYKVHSLPQWIILRCPPRFIGYDPNFPTLPSLEKLSMAKHSSLFVWRKSDEEKSVIKLNIGVNFINCVSSSVTKRLNKLECFPLASPSSLVKYLW